MTETIVLSSGIDWQLGGAPLHVLLVHVVVVVVPIAAAMAILAAAWPAARKRLDVITPLFAAAGLLSIFPARQAGEWLQERIRNTDLVELHADISDILTPWVIGLFLFTLTQWVWFRFVLPPGARWSERVRTASTRRLLTIVIIVATIVVSIGSIVSVVIVGESGSRAVWTGNYQQTGE